MANKEYIWRGYTYRIAEEDLGMYPGAVPVEKPAEKAKAEPKNKARKSAKNKEK